jgi:hypothetical protein
VDGERRQIVGEARRGRGVLGAELTDEDPQPVLGLLWARRPVERRPVRRPDPRVEARPLRQLGQDVAEALDRAATPVGVGPQLGDRPDEPRCSVADDEERAPQPPGDEAPAQIEPVLGPLALTQADIEEDPRPVGREAPGDEHALPGTVRKMDLLGVRLSDGTPMWEAMTTELWPRRHAFVHAGEPVDNATASRALETVDVMVSGFLQPLAHRFQMSWPARSWHNVYFRDPATGNAFGRSYEPDSPFK